MVKVFLVSPDERAFLRNAGDRAPLGILYISRALTENGIENEVFDLNHYDTEKFIKRVAEEKPDWVGLSVVSSPSEKSIKKIAERIKQHTKIVVGGAHVSAIPESFSSIADAVIVGYGEIGILKVIKEGRRGIIREPADINQFPMPERAKLDYRKYVMNIEGLKTATLITSRGCPFNCVFCASHERRVQFRNPESVREEVKELKREGYEAVYILDENFCIKSDHFNAITSLMKEEGMKYRIEMRTNDVTEDRAAKLKDTGCIYVALGLESGDNKILELANKKTSVEQNKRAIEIFHKYQIPVKGFFIIGLPGETEETARKTIEFAEEMRSTGLTDADFYALTPFPGSAIWENPEKYGIKILSRDFDSYMQTGEPVIETGGLSREKIKSLVVEARSRWQKLGKIIITGGSGFIGREIAEKLAEKYEIIFFDRRHGKDVTKKEDFEGLTADYVIHLAAVIKGENSEEILSTNAVGTLNVLEFCKKTGAKLVFASSAAVYGNAKSPIKEDCKLAPISAYGKSKAACESLCEHYHKMFGTSVTILRFFNVYGPGQGTGMLIPDIIEGLKKDVVSLVNPNPKRDYVHVRDVAEAIERSMKLSGLNIINIGTGKSHSGADVAAMMVPEDKKIVYSDNSPSDSDIYADIVLAKKVLGWEPKITLEKGIKELQNNAFADANACIALQQSHQSAQ